jgi:5-methylcytosine-specific restriction endonuclease McrA
LATNYREAYNFHTHQKKERISHLHGKCEECGQKTNLEAHHLISVYIARRNPVLIPNLISSMENMMMLCEDCHHKADQRQRRLSTEEIGWLAWSLFDLDPLIVVNKQWSIQPNKYY